jgi:hypothetical protein
MTVSLRQLEYFVAVVDEGSFTTAAARLHVSQPGLSHQIQALERQLGGPLRRLDPPVQRMLSVYTRVRPDPITAAFVEAICHHTMATPTHILSLPAPSPAGSVGARFP